MSPSPGVQRVPPPFRQIADHYALQIRTGKLKPGDYIPPRYKIAEEWQVSGATAAKATDLLKMRGLVETVPARGLRVVGRAEPEPKPDPQQQQELHEDLAALPPKRRTKPAPRPGVRRP